MEVKACGELKTIRTFSCYPIIQKQLITMCLSV